MGSKTKWSLPLLAGVALVATLIFNEASNKQQNRSQITTDQKYNPGQPNPAPQTNVSIRNYVPPSSVDTSDSEAMTEDLQKMIERETAAGDRMVAVAFHDKSDSTFRQLNDMAIEAAEMSGEKVLFIMVDFDRNPQLRNLMDTAEARKITGEAVPAYAQVNFFVPLSNGTAVMSFMNPQMHTAQEISQFLKKMGIWMRKGPQFEENADTGPYRSV